MIENNVLDKVIEVDFTMMPKALEVNNIKVGTSQIDIMKSAYQKKLEELKKQEITVGDQSTPVPQPVEISSVPVAEVTPSVDLANTQIFSTPPVMESPVVIESPVVEETVVPAEEPVAVVPVVSEDVNQNLVSEQSVVGEEVQEMPLTELAKQLGEKIVSNAEMSARILEEEARKMDDLNQNIKNRQTADYKEQLKVVAGIAEQAKSIEAANVKQEPIGPVLEYNNDAVA